MNNQNNNFKFFPEKLKELALQLDSAWEEGRGIFAKYRDKEMPEATLPSNIEPRSKEHARYLFYVTLANYKTNSDKLFAKARKLYENKPEAFDPEHIRKVDEEATFYYVSRLSAFPMEVNKRWRKNSHLLEKWSDDPRNIIDPSNIRLTEKRMMEFSGFGPKQTPLFLYWVHKYSIVNGYQTYDITYIPVDRHVMSILCSREICSFDGIVREGTLAQPIREECRTHFKPTLIDPFKFQEQIWMYCSKTCTKKTNCRIDCDFEKPCKKMLFEHTKKITDAAGKEHIRKTGLVEIINKSPYLEPLDKF